MSLIFGDYDFGALVDDFDGNFASGAAQTRRLPGVDGGWSDLDDDPADTPPGRLNLSLWLATEDRADMQALRDAIRGLGSLGLQRLEHEHLDPTIGTRYCYARVLDVQTPEKFARNTDLHQRVTVLFEVPDARWFKDAYVSWKLDDGFALDDGKKVGEGALLTNCAGLSTSFSVTNAGNAMALVKVSVMPPTGESCENPKVQRIYNGLIADEIAYRGVIAAEDELFVDGRRHYAALAGDSIFGPNFSWVHPAFFRLRPGANAIRVLFANAGDEADVRLWYRHTWR